MLIAGFSVWSVDAPEAGVELHQALAAGDEDYRQALEAKLARDQRSRWLLIAGLFAGSILMTIIAFLAMRE